MSSGAQSIKAGWLAALAMCFVCCEVAIVRASFFRNDGPLPWAVAFDLLCTLPAAYAWWVLRPAGRPLTELAPLLALSIACTGLLLRHVPAVRLPLHAFSAGVELLLVLAFARRVVRALRQSAAAEPDLVFQAQQPGDLLLRVVAFELCVLYFAFVAPFRRKRVAQEEIFENHAPAQRLLLALSVITIMEAVPLHFLLRAWKPTVAWIVLGLTLYSLCWIAGAFNALSARPHMLSAERVLLRVGLFYTVEIDRDSIARAAPYVAGMPAREVVSLKFVTPPNVLIELSSAARVYCAFGRTKLATQLAFYVEQPNELLRHFEPAHHSTGGGVSA